MVPAQIILVGSANLLLLGDDDASAAIHDLAGEGIPVTVIVSDLPSLGLSLDDLPAYIYAAADLRDAINCARKRGQLTIHWY